MPIWLRPAEQGYYFTFLSLLALQVFFELGFNTVIVQLVGHEVAYVRLDRNGAMEGDPAKMARLRLLITLLKKWYLVAAVMFFAVVSAVGTYFFYSKGGLPARAWLGVWLGLVFFTSVNLYLSPQLAVLEGAGQVGNVARLRLIQSMFGFFAMWLALSMGAGLNAVIISTAVGATFSVIWLFSRRSLVRPIPAPVVTGEHGMSWRREIFPLQWRIGLSWISGYFIFQAFTPFIFSHQGAIEAGKVGVALSIFSSISALGMSWVNASAPIMARQIAKGERRELNLLFRSLLRSSIAFTAVASAMFLALVALSNYFSFQVSYRVASLKILGCLAIAATANSFVSAVAVYMRAHKQEPMLTPSLVGGVLTLTAAYFGSLVNSLLPILLYAGITSLVVLPWAARLFRAYYRLAE